MLIHGNKAHPKQSSPTLSLYIYICVCIGAVRLAAEACQRVGAGLVRVLTHPDSHQAVMFGRPELMVTSSKNVCALCPLLT